jgi:p-hydroxybenzoate 3-monooxygenase
MSLAAADVHVLAPAIESFVRRGSEAGLAACSATCLDRVWRIQHFSWWMTSLLHRFADDTPFDRRRRRAELRTVATSTAAQTLLAEHYVGLPLP